MKHRHNLFGWIACTFKPCRSAPGHFGYVTPEQLLRDDARGAQKERVQRLVDAERDRLYRMIDNDEEIGDDPLLSSIARNRGTLKGQVRRAPRSSGLQDLV